MKKKIISTVANFKKPPMSEAEALKNVMTTQESVCSRQNIDLQPFYLRNVLGTRLRAENRGRIPLLLYWHPNIDDCASVCKIETIGPSTNNQSSIIGRIKLALGVAESLPKNESAVCKLLASKSDTLEHLALNCMKNLKKLVALHIDRVFKSQWGQNWQQRHEEIQKKLPQWDAHDCQTVVAFYIPSGEHSLVVHPLSKWENVDANYHGDDNFLRLYISFEFRRALRDRMIEQQRAAKQAVWQAQFEMQRKISLERQARQAQEERAAAIEAAAAAAAEEEKVKEETKMLKEDDDIWDYEQENSSTMLRRAGDSLANGAQSTGDLVVGGASIIVSGASVVVNSASNLGRQSINVASQGVGTLTSIFRR